VTGVMSKISKIFSKKKKKLNYLLLKRKIIMEVKDTISRLFDSSGDLCLSLEN